MKEKYVRLHKISHIVYEIILDIDGIKKNE
jgi:hypothetical protein